MRNIFIVGVGRSGTSLLHSILGTHCKITAIPETSFLRRYVFGYSSYNNDYKRDPLVNRVPEFFHNSKNFTGNRLGYFELYKKVLDSKSYGKLVVDKDPRLVEFIPHLLSNFENCKVIIVVRDPRDVLLSKKKALWSSGRSFLSYCVSSYVQLSDGYKALKHNNVYTLVYEDLIDNPNDTIELLCKNLNIDFDSNMLDFQSTARLLTDQSELSWKKETFNPIDKKNKNKWQSELSPVESCTSAMLCRIANPDFELSGIKYQSHVVFQSFIISLIVIFISFVYKFLRYFKYEKFTKITKYY